MAKEWVNEAHLRIKAEKFLGATKQECKELALKLITEERERRSVEVGLKNA